MRYLSLIKTKLFLKSSIFLISLFTASGYAQKSIDSVQYYIKESKKTDGELKLQLLQKAMENAKNTFDSISVLRREIYYYTYVGNQDAAYNALSTVISIKTNQGLCKTLDALVLKDLSFYRYYFNQYEQAYDALLKAENITTNLSTKDINDYNKKFNKNLEKNLILSDIKYNLGTIALDQEHADKAQFYFSQYLQLLGEHADEQDIIDAKINLISLLSLRNQYRESIQSYLQLIKDYKLKPIDLSLVYYNISFSYEKLKDYNMALFYTEKAISLSESIKDRIQLIDLYYTKAKLLHLLKNYDHEKIFLEKALREDLKIDDKQMLISLYQAFAENELEQQHLEKAIPWFKKLNTLRDSIDKKNDKIQFHNIDLENQLVEQEQKSIHQEYLIKEAKKRGRLYGWIIVLSIGLLIFMYFYWYSSRINQKKQIQLAEQQIKFQKIKSENKRRIMELEQKRIHEDLLMKNRELLMKVIQHKKRKEKLKLILQEMDKIKEQSIIKKEHLETLKRSLKKHSDDLDKSEDIQQQLMNTHTDFFNQLLRDYPDLSKTELKILAFLRIGLSSKEIAEIQYVSIDAIRKTRHRIRKKLQLDVKVSLEKFLLNY